MERFRIPRLGLPTKIIGSGVWAPTFTAASFTQAKGKNSPSVQRWMNKQNAAHLCNRVSFIFPKKGDSDIHCSVDEPEDVMLSEPVAGGRDSVILLI